jgi:hypothetical protein
MEEWKKVQKDAGYHGKGVITQFVAYDLKKTCREQQE